MGALLRATADNAGKAWTSDETNEASNPHVRTKDNFLDICKLLFTSLNRRIGPF
jgi:hypothetical protein